MPITFNVVALDDQFSDIACYRSYGAGVSLLDDLSLFHACIRIIQELAQILAIQQSVAYRKLSEGSATDEGTGFTKYFPQVFFLLDLTVFFHLYHESIALAVATPPTPYLYIQC